VVTDISGEPAASMTVTATGSFKTSILAHKTSQQHITEHHKLNIQVYIIFLNVYQALKLDKTLLSGITA